MKLRCNKCMNDKRDEASRKTDNLWLVTLGNRDYLVCKFHQRRFTNANCQRNFSRVSGPSATRSQ